MIIDTHVHIGRMLEFDMKREEVLYSMEKYGIDYSIVSDCRAAEFDGDLNPIPHDKQFSQLECARSAVDFAKEYPDKIGAALWLKPFGECADKELYDFIKENRKYIKALKFHPYNSNLPFDDSKMDGYIELAEYFSLPVVSHTGGSDAASCIRVYNMARRYPDVNFVMAHMGLGTDNSEAIGLIGRLPNLYGDTAWVPVENTVRFINEVNDDRIIFGSDNPIDGKDTYRENKFGQPSMYLPYFNELKDLISEESYEKLMYLNAKKLFGL